MHIFLLIALCLLPSTMKAYSYYTLTEPTERPNGCREELGLQFDFFSATHAKIQFPKRSHRIQKKGVTYDEGHALIDFTHYWNDDCNFGLKAGYEDVHIKWADRFRARHDKFQNAVFGASLNCTTNDDWTLSGDFLAHMSIKTFQGRYVAYDTTLRGRYPYSDTIGLHLGAIYFAGMHYTRVYPIIGIDYAFSDDIAINCIFPYAASLQRSIDDNWTIEAGIRSFFTRQRMAKEEHLKRGIIAYRGYGAQIGVLYAIKDKVTGSFHVGKTFKTHMRVSNRHDTHRHHYHLGSKAYFSLGLEILL